MTRPIRVLLLLLAAGALSSVWAGDEDLVFRTDVSLVRVDVQVVDRDNRAITGLSAKDFVLREEGRPQPIRNFLNEDMPVDVLFLLDVSASMRPHVQRIADAARQALRVMGDQDRIGIMVFDRSSRLRMPFRSIRGDIDREFQSLLNQETFHGGTDITRGMYDAANYVGREARRDARRAIVILTDDETEFNRDEDGVSRALTRAQAVLCLLLAPDAMRYRSAQGGGMPPQGGGWPGGAPGGTIWGRPRGPYGGRGPVMRGPRTHSAGTAEIARRSGGDSMPVDDSYSLENTLSRLRQRYALHFNLPEGVKPGQERGIEVTLADATRRRYPDVEVKYRRVYLAPNGSTTAEPTIITRTPTGSSTTGNAGVPGSDVQSESTRRRPAANSEGSRQGPLAIEGSPAASSQADRPQETRSQSDSQPADQNQSGGWRKIKPGEQP